LLKLSFPFYDGENKDMFREKLVSSTLCIDLPIDPLVSDLIV